MDAPICTRTLEVVFVVCFHSAISSGYLPSKTPIVNINSTIVHENISDMVLSVVVVGGRVSIP